MKKLLQLLILATLGFATTAWAAEYSNLKDASALSSSQKAGPVYFNLSGMGVSGPVYLKSVSVRAGYIYPDNNSDYTWGADDTYSVQLTNGDNTFSLASCKPTVLDDGDWPWQKFVFTEPIYVDSSQQCTLNITKYSDSSTQHWLVFFNPDDSYTTTSASGVTGEAPEVKVETVDIQVISVNVATGYSNYYVNYLGKTFPDVSITDTETVGLVPVPGTAWYNLDASASASTAQSVVVNKAWNGVAAETCEMLLKYASKEEYVWDNTSDKLLKVFLDDGDRGEGEYAMMEIPYVPYTKYDVIVYCSTDNTNKFRPVTVNGTSYTANSTVGTLGFAPAVEGTDNFGSAADSSVAYATTTAGNALRITNLTSPTLTIKGGNNDNSARGGIGAIQIVCAVDGTLRDDVRTVSANDEVWSTTANHEWGTLGTAPTSGDLTLLAGSENAKLTIDTANVSLGSLTIDDATATGTGKLTFSSDGSNTLSAESTLVNANLNAVAGISSLGTTQIAVNKTLTISSDDAIGTISGAGTLEYVMPNADNTVHRLFTNDFTGTVKVSKGNLVFDNNNENSVNGKGYPQKASVLASGADAKITIKTKNDTTGFGAPDAKKTLTIEDGAIFAVEQRDTFSMPLILKSGIVTFSKDSTDSSRAFDFFSNSTLTSSGNSEMKGASATNDPETGDPIVNSGIISFRRNDFPFNVTDGTLKIYAQMRKDQDNGNLVKNGDGVLEFFRPAASGYTSSMTVNAGTLRLTNKGQATNGEMSVASGATLDFNIAREGYSRTADKNITNNGTLTKSGVGTLIYSGAITGAGAIQVNGGTLKFDHNNEPIPAGASIEVNTTTIDGDTTQNVLELTGGFRYFGTVSGGGLTKITGDFSLGADNADTGAKGQILTDIEVSGSLRYRVFNSAYEFTPANVIVTSTGSIVDDPNGGNRDYPSLKIATGKVLTNEGTISVPVVFEKDAVINNATSKRCAINETVTFKADENSAYGLTIRLSKDYIIPAGGDKLLSYTSKTGALTVADIALQFVDDEGNIDEQEIPTSWELAVTDAAITLNTKSFDRTLPDAGTTWSALSITPTAMDDVSLTVTESVTLDIDSTDVISMNNLVISGGQLTINNADKLSIAGEISIAEGATLVLNGPTGEEEAPLLISASAITGTGKVVIREGKVKFADIAIGVPVETLAATTEPAKAVGTLYLTNTTAEVLKVDSIITNNGALITDGMITLSNSGNVTSGGLIVNTGTMIYNCAANGSGMKGVIEVVESTATLNAIAQDAVSMSDLVEFNIAGTLAIGKLNADGSYGGGSGTDGTRWTLNSNVTLNLAGGAVLKGAGDTIGDTAYGAVDLNGAIVNVMGEVTITANLRVRETNTISLNKDSSNVSASLILSGDSKGSNDGKILKFAGTGGVVCLNGANSSNTGFEIGENIMAEFADAEAFGSGSITGSGVLVVTNNDLIPTTNGTEGDITSSIPASLTAKGTSATDGWRGTVILRNIEKSGYLYLTPFGNEESTLEIDGLKGYLSTKDTPTFKTLKISQTTAIGTSNDKGLYINNGNGGTMTTITATLTGNGPITMKKPDGTPQFTLKIVGTPKDYTGTLKIVAEADNKHCLILAEDTTPTVEPAEGKIVIATPMTINTGWSAQNGYVVKNVLTVASSAGFDAKPIVVDTTGTLTFTHASSYSAAISGTGLIIAETTATGTLTTNSASGFTGSVKVTSGTYDLSTSGVDASKLTIAGVAEGATLILPATGDAEAALLGRAPTVTYAVAENAEIAGTIQTTLNGTVCTTTGSGTVTGTPTDPNAKYTGPAWWWDYEFNGAVTSSGRFGTTLTLEANNPNSKNYTVYEANQKPDAATNQALYLHQTPYTPDNQSPVYGREFSAVMRCKPDEHANVVLIGFGSTAKNPTGGNASDDNPAYSVSLATGANPKAGEMRLVLSKNGAKGTELVKGGLKVTGATDGYHLYVFTMSVVEDDILNENNEPTGEKKEVTKIEVYADGKLAATHLHDSVIVLGKGFQIGSLHGSVKQTGLTKYADWNAYDAENDTGLIDFLRVADVALSQEAIQKLAAEDDYVYHSLNGKATRDVVTGNWVTEEEVDDNKPWTQVTVTEAEDGSTSTVTSKENSPTEGTNVELAMSGDATLTLNIEKEIAYESLYVKGSGTLTIQAGSFAINPSEVTVETSMTVPYDAMALAGTPVRISGTIENNVALTIDVSALKSRTWQTTDYPLTGLTTILNGTLDIDTASKLADSFCRTATVVKGEGNVYFVRITVPAVKATVVESEDGTAWDALSWEADSTEGAEPGTFTLLGTGKVTIPANMLSNTAKLIIAESATIEIDDVSSFASITLGADVTLTTSASGFAMNKVLIGASVTTVDKRPKVVFNAGAATFASVPHNLNVTFAEGSAVTFEDSSQVIFKGSIIDIQTDMTIKGSRGLWLGAPAETSSDLDFSTTLKVAAGKTVTVQRTGTGDASILLGAWGKTDNNEIILEGSLILENGLLYHAASHADITVKEGGTLSVSSTSGTSATANVAVEKGGTLKWAGEVRGNLSLASGAILDGSVAPSVTGDVTLPTDEGVLKVKLAETPTEETPVLTKAGLTAPKYAILIGTATEAEPSLALKATDTALVVVPVVASANGVAYETLAKALESASEIMLVANVSLTEAVTISGQKVIDLNDKTLTGTIKLAKPIDTSKLIVIGGNATVSTDLSGYTIMTKEETPETGKTTYSLRRKGFMLIVK